MTKKKKVKMEQSPMYSLGWRDILRSFAVASISAIVTALYDVIAGTAGFNFTWPEIKQILIVGFIAGISYLVKNVFTKPDTTITETK
jgi:hypothetical protein